IMYSTSGLIMAVTNYIVLAFYVFLTFLIHVSVLNCIPVAAKSSCCDNIVSNDSLFVDVIVKLDANLLVGVVISPALFERCDKRLCLPAGQPVYKPRSRRSTSS